MSEHLSEVLTHLGFTAYEAKAYLALLQQSPLTGYAIARASRVPRSKIYEVLGGMADRGDVLVSHGEPIQYAPKPPGELIESRRQTAERQFAEAERGLERFWNQKTPRDLIWDIRGRDEVFFRLREVIGRAEQLILVEIWEDDVSEVRDALETAAGRGVAVSIMAYGHPDLPFAQVFSHEPGVAEITEAYGGRWVVLSIDGREMVAGIVSLGRESRAAWSAHLGIVVPIMELIRHDFYIAVMLQKHRDVLEASFGPALRDLREQFGPPATAYRPVQEPE